MKINIISDIHATVDDKNNVIYNYQFVKAHKKYIKTAQVIQQFWLENEQEFQNIPLEFSTTEFDKFYPETAILKTYYDVKLACNTLLHHIETKCVDFLPITEINISRIYGLSRTLRKLEDILITIANKTGKRWSYKKDVLTINDLRTFIFKCVFDFDPQLLEPADILIIAGDLGIEPCYDLILQDITNKTQGKFKKILHIAGNHDHWWFKIPNLSEVKPDSVNLTNDYCEYVDGDYVFLGCTLWTPISDNSIWAVSRYMNDYRYIPNFSPYSSREQYRIQSTWLKSKLAKYHDKKVVVFTHHQPFIELTLDDYKHNSPGFDNVNSAYVVEDHSLDDINKYNNIVLWGCGHTHQCYDGILHGIHVVRNPIGYRDLTGYSIPENTSATWYNKIIEI